MTKLHLTLVSDRQLSYVSTNDLPLNNQYLYHLMLRKDRKYDIIKAIDICLVKFVNEKIL